MEWIFIGLACLGATCYMTNRIFRKNVKDFHFSALNGWFKMDASFYEDSSKQE